MSEQDQPSQPQEAPAAPVAPAAPATAASPPAAAGGGEKTPLTQMRKDLVTEIKELRKQVLLVQLQSMKVMQQSIHSVFKTQTDKTSEQIAQQGTDLQKQLEEETEALKSTAATTGSNADPDSAPAQVQSFNDIVLKAMQAAQQSVDSAMQAAQKIMTDAENILKGA